MKTAIFSDIHGNSKAFHNVLEDAKKCGCNRFVCLGDLVGYGYDPNGCVDLARKHCDTVVLGNHDAAVIKKLGVNWFNETARIGIERDRNVISKESAEYLESLPYSAKEKHNVTDVFFAHGTYTTPEDFNYTCEHEIAYNEIAKLAVHLSISQNAVEFCGHTHFAEWYYYELSSAKGNGIIKDEVVDLKNSSNNKVLLNDRISLVNVGSVGYPRNQPVSTYVIYDESVNSVEYRILPFGFREYVDELEKASIPIPRWMDRWFNHVEGCWFGEKQT